MDTVVRQLAALAPTISNSTLRVLLALLASPTATSRHLSESLRIRRRTVQRVLCWLRREGIIQVLDGLPGYPLTVTGITLPGGGMSLNDAPASPGTPPASPGTPPQEPVVSEYIRARARVSEFEFPTRARAGGFPNFLDIDKTENTLNTTNSVSSVNHQHLLIDQVLRANARDYRKGDVEEIRRLLQNYYRQFGRNAAIDEPGPDIAAQAICAAGDVENVKYVLQELEGERKEAGELYPWIVTVVLQRLRGISPTTVKERRAALKAGKVQTAAQRDKRSNL